MRPARPPCGGPAALSWACAALRGLTPDSLGRIWVPSARTAFERPPGFHEPGRWDGSLRPPALLALSLPCRGPSQHPRTVAGTPKGPRVRRCFLPWAFVPHDTCRNGGPVTRRASRPHGVPRARFGYLLRGVHPRPCGLPCGARASTGFTLRGVLLAPVGLPLGSPCPPAVPRVDSPRSLRCVRTRPASGPRSRRRIRAVLRALAGPERRCLLAIPPSRALSPTVLSGAFVRARSPTTRWAG